MAGPEARLERALAGSGGLLVAFSGGVDSSLLLALALRARGPEAVLAVTASTGMLLEGEVEEARRLAAELGARHRVIELDPLSDPALRANPPERCYLCKRQIFGAMLELARSQGLDRVIEGTNAGDAGDFRPGRRALSELGIRSPLREAGLTKGEIRELSRDLGLPTWDRPALACLASRVPYGEELTPARLRRIGRAEDAVRALGFGHVRVRDHGDLARIEVAAEDIPRLVEPATRARVTEGLRRAGYRYLTVDLEGYRTGAMNETLPEELMREIERGEDR